MTLSLNRKRIGLLLLASTCACLAFALPSDPTGSNNAHRVTGLYKSQLLDDEVSIPALSAFTFTEEFQDLVGASVKVEAVRESPFHIQVTTELPSEVKLLTTHKRAIHLLSAEIKEQAMREVATDLEYLEEVKRKAAKLGQKRRDDETRIALTKPESSDQVLSAKDSQRVIFLKEEIKNLKSFLNGGPLPKTVRARLDRESLDSAEKRLRNQQAELSRLAKLFHPSSKAVQAQRGSVESAASDLAEIERQLADIYLRALRLELETLDDKASSRIQTSLANTEKQKDVTSSTDSANSTGSAWLDERQKELEARSEAIATAASLIQDGKLTFSVVQSTTQFWTVGCWFGTLFFFLLAVFASPPDAALEKPSQTSAPGDLAKSKKVSPPVRIEFPTARMDRYPDRLELFFETVCLEISKMLKRQPRYLLVLGDSDIDTRLAFSIRLANSLGRQAERVRLIDFDFQRKSLSERLGRRDLPGVSELISHGGPVDEFFSSISGTRIQFAPAGNSPTLEAQIEFDKLSQILGTTANEVTIIDSSGSSPVTLLKEHVDAVLWTTNESYAHLLPGLEPKSLATLRAAGLPVWSVSVERMELFRLP